MALLLGVACASAASAAPAPTATAAQRGDGAPHVDHIVENSSGEWDVYVYSPSMNKVIKLQVLRPADVFAPRPTLYLLNGAGGGEDGANWLNQTDTKQFFADKNVNVVIPAEGMFSYYTDWVDSNAQRGKQLWATFLTEELPHVVDAELGGNGTNAIAGLSMAGTSVLNLAIHSPGLYKAVASYSGCALTSEPLGQLYIRSVVEMMGHESAQDMWGPYDGPGWRAHDPYLNAEKLRGTSLFVANGSGLPGKYENPALPPRSDQQPSLLDRAVVGGAIEAATNYCTHRLADRLNTLHIPATFDFTPTGTHSWGYWQDDLHKSWPQIAAALGLKP